MTKSKIALLLTLCLASQQLFSQNVIKVDLFGTIVTTVTTAMPMPKVSYERALTDHLSMQFAIEYGKYAKGESENMNTSLNEYYNVKGFGLMPEIRFYPFTTNRKSPMGFFISAHYRYYSLVENYFEEPYDIHTKAKANNYGFNIGFKHGRHLIIAE